MLKIFRKKEKDTPTEPIWPTEYTQRPLHDAYMQQKDDNLSRLTDSELQLKAQKLALNAFSQHNESGSLQEHVIEADKRIGEKLRIIQEGEKALKEKSFSSPVLFFREKLNWLHHSREVGFTVRDLAHIASLIGAEPMWDILKQEAGSDYFNHAYENHAKKATSAAMLLTPNGLSFGNGARTLTAVFSGVGLDERRMFSFRVPQNKLDVLNQQVEAAIRNRASELGIELPKDTKEWKGYEDQNYSHSAYLMKQEQAALKKLEGKKLIGDALEAREKLREACSQHSTNMISKPVIAVEKYIDWYKGYAHNHNKVPLATEVVQSGTSEAINYLLDYAPHSNKTAPTPALGDLKGGASSAFRRSSYLPSLTSDDLFNKLGLDDQDLCKQLTSAHQPIREEAIEMVMERLDGLVAKEFSKDFKEDNINHHHSPIRTDDAPKISAAMRLAAQIEEEKRQAAQRR